MNGPAASRPSTTRPRSVRRLLLVALTPIALVASACGGDEANASIEPQSTTAAPLAVEPIVDAEAAHAQLVSALRDAGLSSLATAFDDVELTEITDAAEFTFFAPNDDAFTSLTADDLADLLSNPELLRDTLRNHLVEHPVTVDELAKLSSLTSALGRQIVVDESDGAVSVGGATIVVADRTVGDAVIHVVDGFIIPDSVTP